MPRLYARHRAANADRGSRTHCWPGLPERFVILCVMATLIPEDGDLVLSLTRGERLGGFRRAIRVPLSAVEAVAVTDRPFSELSGVRAPGTGIPRVIALGTWRGRGEKGFAAVYRGTPGVVVRLRNSEFAWLCISTDDPQGVAEQIRAAV